MKKTVTLITTLALMLILLAIGASAQSESVPEVYVTVSVKGSLVAVQEKVEVVEIDGDGTLTVCDALYAVHQKLYQGGADAGFGYYTGDYGLSMSKLWGDESGAYGYYINNASCISLADPVKSGDYVTAFVYTSADWSDTYSFFDANTASAKAGESVSLTLSAAGYDAEWNPVTLPVSGATVTVDGQKTAFLTDAQGKVTLTGIPAGEHVISAVSATQTLVPPVCKLTVAASETEAPTTDAPTTDTNARAPQANGCKAVVGSVPGLIAVLCGAAMIKRKQS